MIGLELYARLGDLELVNASRTFAYARAGLTAPGVRLRGAADPCAAIAPYAEATWPTAVYDPVHTFTAYTTPDSADTPAPWYSTSNPHSADFAGLLVEDVTVSSPYERTPTARTRGGSSLPPLVRRGRSITVVGWLLGRTCCSVAYGYRWLNAAIADNVSTVPSTGVTPARNYLRRCATCEKGDLIFFECCPDTDLASCGDAGSDTWPATSTFVRRFINVGVLSGVEILDRRGSSCGCGGCYAMQVQFVLHAEDPYIYSEPVGIDLDGGWDGGAEASFVDSRTLVVTGGTSHVVNRPTYIGQGDLMLLSVLTSGDITVNTPSGFTLVANTAAGSSSSDVRLAVFAKYTAAGEASTYTVTKGAGEATISVTSWTDVQWNSATPNVLDAIDDYAFGTGDLATPAHDLATAGPIVFWAGVRHTSQGNGTFTPPNGYTELVDVSRGVAGREFGHEVAEYAAGMIGGTVGVATATSSLTAGSQVAGYAVLRGDARCAVEWIVTGTDPVTGCSCNDTTGDLLRTPDCVTDVVAPAAPIPDQDCYCEGAATIRQCVQIDPSLDAIGDFALRITVAGTTAPTRMVIRFYRQGDRTWNAADPDTCPTLADNECETTALVIPSLESDETLIIDGMRRRVYKSWLGDDGVTTVQDDTWIGTLDGSPITWPEVCGPTCVCFDLDYDGVTDDTTGELLALPTITVDTIRRDV